MINLMYVVLMAMLALNISTEVLNGFSIVEESLNRTTSNSSKENDAIYRNFSEQMKANPQKVKEWFEKATAVKQMSDSLYNFAQQLKTEIVRMADGKDGDVMNIVNKEDLEAANQVMLAPGTGKGRRLYDAINSFRTRIVSMVTDPHQRSIIESNLTTRLPKNAVTMGKNWQEYMFEDMPVAAAVTLLSKLQSDVRYAEGEVLHTLVSNVDMKDIRVNQLNAFVIPESRTVISGDLFSAQIVMAAVDTMKNANGDIIRRDFTQKYTVVGPSATVSADLMNVLYAGYENPISISIPGVPLSSVSASMSGGSFRSIGMGRYIARPTTVGQDVTITVSANQNGRTRQMGKYVFKVRKLPDPTAYLQIGTDRFKEGGLPKASLMGVNEVKAAIDDGILDIQFRVQSFETVFFDNMGNAVPMASDGASFSSRQKETFRKLSRNKRFYISRVTAVGPDGITRRLPGSMEVIVK